MIRTTEKHSERGVSETVGFILIFAIVMTGIGLVTLYGYPILLQEQANANIRNMEKNMIVLQSDLNSLTFKNVPYQETTMQVSGGTLFVKGPSSTNQQFLINKTDDQTEFLLNSFSPGEMSYESDDRNTLISLENGAVHKRYWSDLTGSAMISDPRWFYDGDTGSLVITFIQIYSESQLSQTGIGTVQMKVGKLPEYELSIPYDPAEKITITYIPDIQNNYKVAWHNYFSTIPENEYSGTDATLTIGNVQNLVVKAYNVSIIGI
jgi:hypothetical protein